MFGLMGELQCNCIKPIKSQNDFKVINPSKELANRYSPTVGQKANNKIK